MATVRLFGGLRRRARDPKISVDGVTARDVLASLCRDNPGLHAVIWDGARVRDHVRGLIGGQAIELGRGLATRVTADDEIAIFPPIGSGGNTT